MNGFDSTPLLFILPYAADAFHVQIRFPLGGILCVIGVIVYLLGSAALRQLVAEEGVFKALLYRFCPPYQWWYVLTHWEGTRDFFAFFLAGAAIMTIGGGIIKTSAKARGRKRRTVRIRRCPCTLIRAGEQW
jgi:hypothetical protein